MSHETHSAYIPRDKHDTQAVDAAIRAGYPTVAPVLRELLEWLQDANWPVARPLAPFLAGIGVALRPHVEPALQGDDNVWKYWLLTLVVAESEALAHVLAPTLARLAGTPTAAEREEDVDQAAQAIIDRYGIGTGASETTPGS
jgi:hypothetical protein